MSAEKTARRRLANKAIVQSLFAGVLFFSVAVLIKDKYPLGVDWEYTFSQVLPNWLDPYQIPTFANPPWVFLFLPHSALPINWSNAINFLLNVSLLIVVAHHFGGNWRTYLLIFTNPFFFDLARTNNVEWIVLWSLLLPPAYGLPLLLIKPQNFGAIALIWFKRHGWPMLLPTFLILSISFVIWGFWPMRGSLPFSVAWNFSTWPLGIPLGLYMLFRAYKEDNEFIAAAATPFLVPYIAPYSLVTLFALLGGKYKRETFFAYVAIWTYFVIQLRRDGI